MYVRTQKNGRFRPSASSSPINPISARSVIALPVEGCPGLAIQWPSRPSRSLLVEVLAPQQAQQRDQDQPVCQDEGKKVDQAPCFPRLEAVHGFLTRRRLTRR